MRLLNRLGWYTFAQAERALGYSHGHLHRLVAIGAAHDPLRAHALGGRRADLHALLCARLGVAHD